MREYRVRTPVTLGIRNRTRDTVVARGVRIADTTWSRLVGLLDRASLGEGEGLWLRPTSAIHTVGMRFSIDAVFVSALANHRCEVRRIYHRLPPWRMTRYVWGSDSVLELPAGAAAASGTSKGDELEFERE